MSDTVRTAGGDRHLIGIDVGTGSARAGVFRADGTLVGSAKHPISIHRGSGIGRRAVER